MTMPKPRTLSATMDIVIARAVIAFQLRVEVLAQMDMLVYSGDDWPQPHPALGMPRLPWEDWPSTQSLVELRDRISATTSAYRPSGDGGPANV